MVGGAVLFAGAQTRMSPAQAEARALAMALPIVERLSRTVAEENADIAARRPVPRDL